MRSGNLRDTSDGAGEGRLVAVVVVASSFVNWLSGNWIIRASSFMMLCTNWIASIDHKVPISTHF